MCGYFCIRFIDVMLKGKSWLDDTNLFSPNEYEKNDKKILKYLQWFKTKKFVLWADSKKVKMSAISIENLKTLKYHIYN